MEIDEIKRLLSLMEEHDLVEIELEEGNRKVRLRKAEEHAPAHPQVVVAAGGNHPLPVPAPAAAPGENREEAKRPDNGIRIRSPLVGTFYTAPKPGADPFVNVGDVITPDKVVCLVEAMKVMNEIKAEVGGRVREIPAKNGQPVEFNEVLFVVDPAE